MTRGPSFQLHIVGIVLFGACMVGSSLRHEVSRGKRASSWSGNLLKECPEDKIPTAAKRVPTHEFTFTNETHAAIDLHWFGKDSKTILVLSTTTAVSFFARMYSPSSLWRSTDGGRHYDNITAKINGDPISSEHGILKSPADSSLAIIVAVAVRRRPQNRIYVTKDAGATITRVLIPFKLVSIRFHKRCGSLVLADSAVESALGRNGTLYLSEDHGFTWKLVMADVTTYEWGPGNSSVFVSVADHSHQGQLKLLRTDDLFKTYRVIASQMYRFVAVSDFLFASVFHSQDSRSLYVSKMKSQSVDWQVARLPEAKDTGLFFVLDGDDMVLIHVDSKGDGHGAIFASDSSGMYYTKTLDHHVHTGRHSDFYKVRSMRGTYITSVAVLGSETPFGTTLVASRISFDRGARWQQLQIDNCDEDGDKCSLHIHGSLSMMAGVIKQVPASNPGAPGLILAHGNKGMAQSKAVDIYRSLDGGYTWTKILEGPHFYAIADQGKLLVAVPIARDHTADTMYFSENHGECWLKVKFSTTPWHFTGLQADPEALGLKITLWGYTPADGLWQTMEVDFSAVVERPCTPDDYRQWLPHALSARDGCLLGYKETLDVIKSDVWCYVPDEGRTSGIKPCKCVLEDLECDFGYIWNSKKTECIKDESLPANVSRAVLCSPGQNFYNESLGYRRIPGDKCRGGVTERLVMVRLKPCLGHVVTTPDMEDNASRKHHGASIAVAVVFVVASLLTLAYVLYKVFYPQRRGRFNYTYSALRTNVDDASDNENSGAVAPADVTATENDVRIVNA